MLIATAAPTKRPLSAADSRYGTEHAGGFPAARVN